MKTCFERDEMPRLPQMTTATVTMSIQKKVLRELNEPNTLRVRGHGRGRNAMW